MNVSQFLERLSYGPLSNLSISNEGDGTIIETKQPALVGYLNEALLHLFTRFDLLEKEIILEQVEGRSRYPLNSAYAVSTAADNPLNPHYIIDTIAIPFTDDLLKILSVWKAGTCDPIRLPLNDDNSDDSLFTPKSDLLQVPKPIAGEPLYLIYQARHPVLSHTDLNTTIDLPVVFEEALLSYVAHKVYFYMNGQEHARKAAEHLATYESICNEVKEYDLVSSSLSFTNAKFQDRGFC
jgi:hypothetical protein